MNQSIDLELIRQIRAGEQGAKERLVAKYVPMVKYIIRNYYASFLDFDDLLQEGLIGLLNAIDEYKPDEYDVKFSSFAYICIIRRVYNVIKQTNGNKHRLLNEAVSLQSAIGFDENRTVLDLIPAESGDIDPEHLIEEKIVNNLLDQVLKNHLSVLEYAVIVRLLKGYTCSEIQQDIGVGPKVIDNARTRVKAKLKRLLGEYGSLLSPDVPTEVRRREDLYLDLPIQN
ncbi:MAG: sigma-70 family RNA polymerase sigma factor [Firmicutes bacterium]|jgi:RNA polymerase sporulation-specific sigma factor|nr:sigma-70 family RNA polymerase sigma factor [Bacillota bacterium]